MFDFQRVHEFGDSPRVDLHVGETELDRIRSTDGTPGQRDVRAELTGCAREQPGAPDIRDEPDPHLGQPEGRPLGHDPM